MKKTILAVLASVAFSGVAFAADSHDRYVGSVDAFTGSIKNQAQFDDLIKYTDYKTQAKLRAAFKDGTLTAEEIKSSGISDHHFYTGYLASAKSQAEYDKYLKQLNNGANVDDSFISNRDLKANNSMVMNQVQAGNKIQDARSDKLADGLKQLGDHVANQTAPTPPVEGAPAYDDSAVKESIQTNTDDIAAVGGAVDKVYGYMEQMGDAIKNSSNAGVSGRIDNLENAFQAQAAHTASEISRLDGRIDSLEKKTDKLKAGVAGAIAIGSLTQYTGSGTHHVAVGIGGYEGASALAGGYTYAISAQTTIRGTVAYDSEGDFGFGASVGHSW
ncbi:MAG: YadA C-terminal domain-containing protein [Bacteroidales bacterium]